MTSDKRPCVAFYSQHGRMLNSLLAKMGQVQTKGFQLNEDYQPICCIGENELINQLTKFGRTVETCVLCIDTRLGFRDVESDVLQLCRLANLERVVIWICGEAKFPELVEIACKLLAEYGYSSIDESIVTCKTPYYDFSLNPFVVHDLNDAIKWAVNTHNVRKDEPFVFTVEKIARQNEGKLYAIGRVLNGRVKIGDHLRYLSTPSPKRFCVRKTFVIGHKLSFQPGGQETCIVFDDCGECSIVEGGILTSAKNLKANYIFKASIVAPKASDVPLNNTNLSSETECYLNMQKRNVKLQLIGLRKTDWNIDCLDVLCTLDEPATMGIGDIFTLKANNRLLAVGAVDEQVY